MREPGELIGPYKLVRKLGAGTFGAVYEAVDEHIGRRVALKILHSELLGTPDASQRFLTEARAANLVPHPGIVHTFAYGTLPDSCPYIVMELLDGELLQQRMASIDVPTSIRVARQIASILCAAHTKGVIHRDLKPDNVLLIQDREVAGGERVKLLDLGIAKVTDPGAELDAMRRTQDGVAMGTPTYMSPEQAQNARGVTDRTDTYALGVLLYQMLGKQAPFQSSSARQVLALHVYKAPQPLGQLNEEVPAELAALVDKMMAKKADERPAMDQVAAELEALDPQFWLTPRKKPAPIKRPLGWWAVLAGVSLGLGGLGLGLGSALHRPERVAANIPAVQADASAKKLPPSAPAVVHWSLSTTPDHAQVVRRSDDSVLGQTPWIRDGAPEEGELEVVLRHPGFLDQPVVLQKGQDLKLHEHLCPAPPPPPEPPPKSRHKSSHRHHAEP